MAEGVILQNSLRYTSKKFEETGLDLITKNGIAGSELADISMLHWGFFPYLHEHSLF